jgi:hypothetical protein
MSVDAKDLERYLALLESADATINRDSAAALKNTVDQLVDYAQSIEARKSGHMADSTHQLGPFASGGGILTSTIQSAASYADIVAARGGDYDWPNRTLSDQAALLEQLQERTEHIVAAAVGGDR